MTRAEAQALLESTRANIVRLGACASHVFEPVCLGDDQTAAYRCQNCHGVIGRLVYRRYVRWLELRRTAPN